MFRPALDVGAPEYTDEQIAAVERLRDISFDPDKPLVLHVDVDHEAGKAAPWYPRGESPLLKELVDSDELPPVAERVGPEPAVMRGVEGIGNYGGTWMRLATTDNDISVISWRLSSSGLVRWSPYGYPIKPHLARSIESSPDRKVWTVHLRRGVRWSDGHPFTADDILYWWQYEVHDEAIGSGNPPDWMHKRGEAGTIEKIDDFTIRFTFPYSHGLFLEALAASSNGICNSPNHYLSQFHPTLGDPDFIRQQRDAYKLPSDRALYSKMKHFLNPEHPRMWPWVYRTFRSNPPQVFIRNPYYFVVDERGNQLPYIDRVQFEVADAGTMALKFSKGYVSMQTRHVRYENVTELMDRREEYGTRILHWYPATRSNWVINPNLNRYVPGNPKSYEACETAEQRKLFQKKQLLSNATFRKALSLAINRKAIIKAEYNNQTRPSQVAPGRESPFHNERLAQSYIEYEPDRARQMLDEIGLTQRDLSGMRTFPDGSPMTLFLDFSAFTGVGPAQFIVDDWANVGVRVIARERQRNLLYRNKNAADFDFNVWSSESEFFPVIQPRYFVPPNTEAFYAVGWGRWYANGGFYGAEQAKKLKSAFPPPKDHPMYRAYVVLEEAKQATTLADQARIFDEALEIAADNIWTIGISEAPPQLVVVSEGLRNVPETAMYAANQHTPGNAGIETYFFVDPADNDATKADTLRQLREVVPVSADSGSSAGGMWLGRIIRWTVVAIGVALLGMVALRHPFVARRVVIMIPTLLVISIVVFTIIQLPPGDYLTSRIVELQESGDDQALKQIQDLRTLFRFDDPLITQYFRWMGGLLRGDLGRSMATTEPVTSMVGDRILLTVAISAGTILFTWAIAIPIGIYSAVRQYSVSDYVFTLVGFIGMSVPGFLLALVISVLADVEGLFSSEYAAQVGWTWDKFFDLLQHIWVPIVVMGVTSTAGMIRIMRANLLDELKKPYVTTARAKGVRPIKLLLKYPVRVALNPFISGIGHIFPQLVSGGAIVAMVLSLPTVGPMLLSALFSEDMYLAGSMLMVLSLLGVFGTLVSDLLLLWLDPRIRYEKGGK